MSRARSVKYALPIFALLPSAACATTDAEPQVSAEEQAYKDAIELALKPATPEEIAQAERSDPITRANFWAAEYQKDPANAEVTVRFMNALRKIGSHERVAEIASAAIPIHPTEHELLLELGRSFMAQERFADAAQAVARSADLSPPTDAAPLAALGLAFDRLEGLIPSERRLICTGEAYREQITSSIPGAGDSNQPKRRMLSISEAAPTACTACRK